MAGDVLLLARSGLERPLEERFYFSKPYRSWHGSPTLQDSHIPFILARKGDTGEQLQAIVTAALGTFPSQLDFVPLVQALFGHARQHTPPLPVKSTKVHKAPLVAGPTMMAERGIDLAHPTTGCHLSSICE
jgi:hypothetical protein